jgi:TolB-like protein
MRQIRGKVDILFEDMGPQSLKNIAEPMRAWRVKLCGDVGLTRQEPPPKRLSIAVLPFVAIGGDSEHGYFADGLTASLTTDLTRISDALVIASSTTSTLKGSSADVRQIGRDLDVRYLLKGSVQKAGSKLRINAQLIETAQATQLWVDRFDGDETDLFELQDQLTSRIANSVSRKIAIVAAKESETRTTNATVIDHLMRGLVLADKPQTLENLSQQENHFRKVLELEPRSTEAMARLGRSLCLQGWQFGSMLKPEAAAQKLSDGARIADQALAIDPDHAFAHIPKGLACIAQGDFPEARRIFERAYLLDRNLVLVLTNLATINVRLGQPLEAIRYAEQAIRIDPHGPQIAVPYVDIGNAQFLLGNDKAALAAFFQARTLNPRLPRIYPGFAALLARTGDASGASGMVAELLRLAPNFKLSKSVDYPTPFSPTEYIRMFEDVFLPAARLAGLPE